MFDMIEVSNGEVVKEEPTGKPADGREPEGGHGEGELEGAQRPKAKPPAAKAKPATGDERPRGADGRFTPKEGAPDDEDDAPPPAKAKIRVKWTKDRDTGEEVEEELDEDEVARRSAASHGLHRKFEALKSKETELQKEREALESFKKELKEGKDRHRALRKFIRDSGLDADGEHELLCNALEEIIHESNRAQDPRARALDEREAKIREEEKQAAQAKLEAEKKSFTEKVQVIHKQLMERCSKALQASDLPKTERTLSKMGDVYLKARKNGLDLTEAELAEETREALLTDVRALSKGLTGAQIRKHLPDLYRAVHLDLRAIAKQGKTAQRGVGAPRPPVVRRQAQEQDDGPITFSSGDARSFSEALGGK